MEGEILSTVKCKEMKGKVHRPNIASSLTAGSSSDMNETCDFASGCTPYKSVAKNAVKCRTGNQRKLRVDEKSRNQTIVNNSTNCQGSSEGVKDEFKTCEACGQSVQLDSYTNHVKKCLKQKFQRGGSDGKRSKRQLVICQICQDDISCLSLEFREIHINCCMNNHRRLKDTDVPNVCPMCSVNMTNLNIHRRTQHINRCAAKEDEQKKAQAAALEKARNKVLDCPLCGQNLKTENSRKTHLKLCAKKFNVSASVLRDRVQEQECEYKAQLEAGIIPAETVQPRRRRRAPAVPPAVPPAAQTSNTLPELPPEVPHNALDEDTQLAIALSESMREERSRLSQCSRLNGHQISIPEVISKENSSNPVKNAFSILMTPNKGERLPNKKGRKKIHQVKLYKLTQVSQDQRLALLENRVGDLLSSTQGNKDVIMTPVLPKSKIVDKDKEGVSLWYVDNMPEGERGLYYVKELEPQVLPSDVQTGSKLKKMSHIPGWNSLEVHDVSVISKVNPVSADISISSETLYASTQTAVILAELASNTSVFDVTMGMNNTQSVGVLSSKNSNKANKIVQFSEPSTETLNIKALSQGFCQPDQDSELVTSARDSLLQDLAILLEDKTDTDFTILCKDNEEVSTHKLFIKLRCPQLYEMAVNDKADLRDCSATCVRALLRYIYTGDVTVDTSLAAQLKNLSENLNLPEMSRSCVAMLQNSPNQNTFSCHRLIDQTLQNLLHDAWGSDTDISGDEATADHTAKSLKSVQNSDEMDADSEDKDDSELELDELYELVSSQNQNIACDSEDDEENLDEKSKKSLNETLSITMNDALLRKLEESFMFDSPGHVQITYSDEKSGSSIDNSASSDVDSSRSGTDESQSDVAKSEAEINIRMESISTATPASHVSQISRLPEENTPDLFGDESFEDEKASERDFVGTSKSVMQSYTMSPVGDLFDSDDCNADESAMHDLVDTMPTLENIPDKQNSILDDSVFENSPHCPVSATVVDVISELPLLEQNPSSIIRNCEKRKRVARASCSSDTDVNTPCHDHKKQRKSDLDVINKYELRENGNSHAHDISVQSDDLVSNHSLVDLTLEDCSGGEDEQINSATEVSKISDPDIDINSALLSQSNAINHCSPEASNSPNRHEYSMPDVWDDFDGGYDDFGIPVTQRHSTITSNPCSTIYDKYNEPNAVLVPENHEICIGNSETPPQFHTESDSFDDPGKVYSRQSLDQQENISDLDYDLIADPEPGILDVSDDFKAEKTTLSFVLPNETPKAMKHPAVTKLQNGFSPHTPFKTPDTRYKSRIVSELTSPEYDPPTDIDTDMSMTVEPADSGAIWRGNNQVHSKKKKKTISDREWVPPSPFTPMANYQNMLTPQLKQECAKYGVRALPKKKMMVVLEDLYKKTHTYETDSDYDGSPVKEPEPVIVLETSSVSKNKSQSTTNKDSSRNIPKPSKSAKPKKAATNLKAATRFADSSESDIDAQNVDDGDDFSSTEMDNSQESVMSEVLEETLFMVDDEPKISKKDLAYKRQCIWDFIHANQPLHLSILHFQPLDFVSFHQQLKDSGLNVGEKVICDFLDDQNILFTKKNKVETRHRKKQRKGLKLKQKTTQN